MSHKVYVDATMHFVNIPKFLQNIVIKNYWRHRSEITHIFNAHIVEANAAWETTGKNARSDDPTKEFNPEYVQCIHDYIQPYIDEANKHFYICKYKIDVSRDANIVAYVPFLRNSAMWLTISQPEG